MTKRIQAFLPPERREALLRDPRVVNMQLLVDTFPWPARVCSFFLWRTPLRYLVRSRFVNPYAQIVITMDTSSAPRGKQGLDSAPECVKPS